MVLKVGPQFGDTDNLVHLRARDSSAKGKHKLIPFCAIRRFYSQAYQVAKLCQHRGSRLASYPAAPGSIPSIPKSFCRGKIIGAAEVNQWGWLEESAQWLEHVDQTHQVELRASQCYKKTVPLEPLNIELKLTHLSLASSLEP